MSVKKTSQILKLKLKKSKLAIIDIGSNSVRLVIYPDSGKYPYPLFNERIFSAGKINSLLFFEFLTAAVATGTICFTSIFLIIIENRCKAFNALEIDLVDNFPVSNNFSPNLQLILSLKRG